MKKTLIAFMLIFLNALVFAQYGRIEKPMDPQEEIDHIFEQWHEEYELLSVEPLRNQKVRVLSKKKNAIQYISDSAPIYCIKVEWTTNRQFLEFSCESYYDRFGDRKLDFHKKVEIPREAVDKLVSMIEECDFYNQPPTVWTNGRDGYTEVVEVSIDGKYWCVKRWDPGETFVKDITNYMFDLADERDRLYPPAEREKDEWNTKQQEAFREMITKKKKSQ